MGRAIDALKGQASHVMRVLGPGHTERIYHNALITALNHRAIPHRSEVSCPIWFMGQCIGMGRADLVISNLIVEIKANKLPPSETSAQLRKYIQSLSRSEHRAFYGVVINFNQKTGCVDVLEEQHHHATTTRLDTIPSPPPAPAAVVESAIFRRSISERSATLRPAPPIVKRRRLT